MTNKLEKILIADDREENRAAARIAMPNAYIASSASEAIAKLGSEKYDLVITDMQMEHELAGLDVVRESLRRQTPCYVLTSGGRGHGNEKNNGNDITELKPYCESIMYDGRKAIPAVWKIALERIKNPNELQRHYQESVERAKRYNVAIILPEELLKLCYLPRDLRGGKNGN
jgi:CheY-like chemotaxis protein